MKYPSIMITIAPQQNKHIDDVCKDVKILSEHLDTDLSFTFNGVLITTENNSINEMIRIYTHQIL